MEKKTKQKPHYDVSKVTGNVYNVWDQVHIMNIEQAKFYIERGVPLTDIDFSPSRKDSSRMMVVFLFNQEDTREAWDIWRQRKGD